MNKQNILIVDDELVFARAIKNHLTRKSLRYDIKTAPNGKDALETLIGNHIDLVVLDINMPVMDGIEFLMELHNEKIWLPIIILTGSIIMPEAGEGKIFSEYGIVEYLEKPVDFDDLDKKVEEVLNHFEIVKKPASGIGLPTILRVIDSEKRTGILTVKSEQRTIRIFFRNGDVVDAEAKNLSAEEAFETCLRNDSSDTKISIEYINHRREKKINISFYEVLLDESWLIKEDIEPKKKEEPTAPTEPTEVFEGLGSVRGFIGAAVFHRSGSVIDSKIKGDVDLRQMGELAVELFQAAGVFTEKMKWGSADFIEIRTADIIFVYTGIVPGMSALGVVLDNTVNMGRIKLEIQKVVKKFSH